MPLAAETHGWIEDTLHVTLSNHVTKHRLGKIYSGDTGFLCSPIPMSSGRLILRSSARIVCR